MNLINRYNTIKQDITDIKEELINILISESGIKKIAIPISDNSILHIIKFSQLEKWGVHNYMGAELANLYSYNIRKNIESSKDIHITLSNMLICGNMTNYKGAYFMKLTTETLDLIATILNGNVIIPKLKRNISGNPSKMILNKSLSIKYPHLKRYQLA